MVHACMHKWKTSQVLFSKIVVRNVEENLDVTTREGSKEMIELIKNTFAYINKAINGVTKKVKANSI